MLRINLLLNYTVLLLFLMPVHAAMPILKTGQTVSYDQEGNISSELKDDGYYQAGADRNYSRSSDIVTDHTSSLMWQDDGSSGVTQSWDSATNYCGYISLGGYEDWRLPTIKELETLIDLGSEDLLNDSFQNGHIYNYWSSNTILSSSAWFFRIEDASIQSMNKTISYGTRCVRNF